MSRGTPRSFLAYDRAGFLGRFFAHSHGCCPQDSNYDFNDLIRDWREKRVAIDHKYYIEDLLWDFETESIYPDAYRKTFVVCEKEILSGGITLEHPMPVECGVLGAITLKKTAIEKFLEDGEIIRAFGSDVFHDLGIDPYSVDWRWGLFRFEHDKSHEAANLGGFFLKTRIPPDPLTLSDVTLGRNLISCFPGFFNEMPKILPQKYWLVENDHSPHILDKAGNLIMNTGIYPDPHYSFESHGRP